MVKDFNVLTRLGKIRRLHIVAARALTAYDIEVERIRFLTIETNTHFVIHSKSGERFVLRIYSDEETTLSENQAEVYWLGALLRDTDIKVTEPVLRTDGKYISIVTVPGVPPRRRCVLFRWIPGRTLEEQVSPENYFKLGQAMAMLHLHAETLKPLPPQIKPKRWDKVFYYPDEPVVYNDPEYSSYFSGEAIQIMDSVIRVADQVFQDLFKDTESLILIHGDLHYWNVHVHRGQLYLIDFEDINLGYPVQDIAVTLSYGRQREGYQTWKDAFIQGYTSLNQWPPVDDQIIPTLMAARSVMLINYIARVVDEPQSYIKSRLEGLREFLNDYG